MAKAMKYELTFFGSAMAPYFPKRYRRHHNTAESVHEAIAKVFCRLENRGLPTACHSPVIYDNRGHALSPGMLEAAR